MRATTIRFDPGKIVMTPGAIAAMASARQQPSDFLHRHITGDWGELDAHDTRANEAAMRSGLRLLSAYKTAEGEDLWVITEAIDIEAGDHPARRAMSTILLPSDY
jgi:hypothetical protein